MDIQRLLFPRQFIEEIRPMGRGRSMTSREEKRNLFTDEISNFKEGGLAHAQLAPGKTGKGNLQSTCAERTLTCFDLFFFHIS
jgi:hypothetical protein